MFNNLSFLFRALRPDRSGVNFLHGWEIAFALSVFIRVIRGQKSSLERTKLTHCTTDKTPGWPPCKISADYA